MDPEQTDGGESILVVDDDPFLCDLLSRYLKREGYSVAVAGSAKDAMASVKNKMFAVAVLDVIMDESNGIELIDLLQAFQPSLGFVVMTGHPSMENALEAMKHGVRNFMIKPFQLEHFGEVIKKTLEERQIRLDNDRLRQELEDARGKIREYEQFLRQGQSAAFQSVGVPSTLGEGIYRVQSLQNRKLVLDEKLKTLSHLKEEGILTDSEYEAKRKQLLSLEPKDDHA